VQVEEPRPPDDSPPDLPMDPAINTTLRSDQTCDTRHHRPDPLVPAAQGETATQDSPTDDTDGFFDYTYTPPSDKIIQDFDSTQQLGSQIQDQINDNFNTLTTDGKHGQIRIRSLNINGLTDVKLGLLLNYMDLKKLDILALQDTRLSQSESNRLASMIRRDN